MSHVDFVGQQTKDEFGSVKKQQRQVCQCNILTFVRRKKKRRVKMLLQGDNTRHLLIGIHQCCFTFGSASINAMLAGGRAKIRLDEFFVFVNELVRGTVNDGIEVDESTTDARVSQARDVFSLPLTLILNKHLTRPSSLPFDVCIQLNNGIVVVVVVKSDSGSVRVCHTSNKR